MDVCIVLDEIRDSILVDELSHISGKSIDEIINTYINITDVPKNWFQEIINTHIDVYLPPEEWLMVWNLSGLQKPEIKYGIFTQSRIHDVLLRQFSYQDKTVEWIKKHFRPLDSDDEICRREIGIMDYGTMIKSDTIIYAFYDSQSEYGEIVVGILCLYEDDVRKELFISILCTDGTYNGLGSRLMLYAKQLLVFQSPYKRIELDSLSSAVEFYKKMGFIQKPGNQMIWTPSDREIYDFIKKYPTLFPIITQKWPQYSMEYIRERKRLQLLGLMEEAQYEKNAGTYKRRNRSHVKKGRTSKTYSEKIIKTFK
jgi:hypothetical protein